ncbi:DUF1801 domain-containing protein [Paenibacillus mendelii]|uniref:DUF1801 domain-containing protein n=1 Tax=Paenibacillus mendelii TaxID=206163 RepID=A0ABV6J888_9BACL
MPKMVWNRLCLTSTAHLLLCFSVAKHHLAVAPERAGINHCTDDIVQADYDHTKELVRIRLDSPVDFSLLEKMIEFNILDKADCSTFWRK